MCTCMCYLHLPSDPHIEFVVQQRGFPVHDSPGVGSGVAQPAGTPSTNTHSLVQQVHCRRRFHDRLVTYHCRLACKCTHAYMRHSATGTYADITHDMLPPLSPDGTQRTTLCLSCLSPVWCVRSGGQTLAAFTYIRQLWCCMWSIHNKDYLVGCSFRLGFLAASNLQVKFGRNQQKIISLLHTRATVGRF